LQRRTTVEKRRAEKDNSIEEKSRTTEQSRIDQRKRTKRARRTAVEAIMLLSEIKV
jgi:hypothetical protein